MPNPFSPIASGFTEVGALENRVGMRLEVFAPPRQFLTK